MPEETPKISPHVFERVHEWVEKADHFMASAERLTEQDRPSITDTACLLAHGAAERYLKSFLVMGKEKYRKYGHDLVKIVDACAEIDPDFKELMEDADSLSVYKPTVDYPDIAAPEIIPDSEAKRAVLRAKNIRDFVIRKLQEHGCR